MAFTPEQKKVWRAANREKIAAYKEQWLARNPDKIKIYAERNKERDRKKTLERRRLLGLPDHRQRQTVEETRQKKAARREANKEQYRLKDLERRERERAINLWEQALAGFNIWGKKKIFGYQWVEPAGRMREHTLYALRDPRTQEVRYIGKTVNPKERLKGHLASARLGHPQHIHRWIRRLLTDGLKPQWEVLEVVIGNVAACERERALIAEFKSVGARLVNSTIGGEGAPGAKMPESHKRGRTEYMKRLMAGSSERKKRALAALQSVETQQKSIEAIRRKNPWAWLKDLPRIFLETKNLILCQHCGKVGAPTSPEFRPIKRKVIKTPRYSCVPCRRNGWKKTFFSVETIQKRRESTQKKNPWAWVRNLRRLVRTRDGVTWCDDCGRLFNVEAITKGRAILCAMCRYAHKRVRWTKANAKKSLRTRTKQYGTQDRSQLKLFA
jgi:hypothetical protein